MPPKSKLDSSAATLFFKKHKTTVLLMLQTHESLDTAKEKLLEALNSRGVTDINGDPVPDDSFDIEFGVPMDRADLEKGWRRLDADAPELDEEGTTKKNKGKSKKEAVTLMAAGLENGHTVAFRFRKPNEGQDEMDLDYEDPGWDVLIPTFDDEDEE
ncbi:hypothetical protein N7467_009168 [Penicillium canescens]|nr:hypothetical protein N7467_009168 [Penicillium canescens]